MQQEQFLLPKGVTVVNPLGDRYVIEGLLGKGEFGAVYMVRERDKTHSVFALKEVINPNKGDRERIAFEGEVLKRLRHRALPRVYYSFENDKLKRVYLLMDYIEGRNLDVLRAEQPEKCFPLSLTLVLLSPIVDALVYLHSQHPPIVHRDIKPANVIIPTQGNEAILADFGSAKEYVPSTGTNMLDRRSPGYAAPELYRKGTNPSTDIYSLGATLYALLTGVVPVNAPFRVLEILNARVDPLKPINLLKPEIPLAVSKAVQRALSIKSEDRFQTVAEFWQVLMAHDTSAYLSRTPHPAQASELNDTEPLQKARFAFRSRSKNVLSVFVGLLVIGAIMGFLSQLWSVAVLCLLCIPLLFLCVLLYNFFSRKHSSEGV